MTTMAKNYAHCPLKKRPIVYDSNHTEEPENLSTKPEDLSKNFRIRVISPALENMSPDSPQSSLAASPSSSPPMETHYPLHLIPDQLKLDPAIIHPPSISPDYIPTTWHKSVAPAYPPAYRGCISPYLYNPNEFPRQVSPYSDHHQNPIQPLVLRPVYFSSSDQNCLSPNSSNASSTPPPHPMEVSDKRRHGARHQCPDCGKSYSTYSGLSKHRQFHCAAGDGPKKSFSCKYCEKIYVSLGALKMHIRTHTLPCKCTICGKAFSRPWLLQGHIRTHTGEKPFSCTYCQRAFADRSNLRAHLQTHSDIKKYSCSNCNKTFSRMSLLNKHSEGGCSTIGVIHE